MENQKNKNGIYPEHFYTYIRLVENEDLNTVLKNQLTESQAFFNSVPKEKYDYKYAEGKWSIKEALQHIIDTERVFTYRSLAFSRKDVNILPSFDDKSYAANANGSGREWNDLVDEFTAVRKSTQLLFNSFSPEQLDSTGKGSGYQMNARAMGYTIAGHLAHHINIIKERYLR
ncbi:MAG TPA: DinB family protein [Hanamia sp.]|nr:DinB family protein [Hanamia sp.]